MARDRGLLLCRCMTVRTLVDVLKGVVDQLSPAVLYVHIEKPQKLSAKLTSSSESLQNSTFQDKTNYRIAGISLDTSQNVVGACTLRSDAFLKYIHKFYAECSTLRPAIDVRLFVDSFKREFKNDALQHPSQVRNSRHPLSYTPEFYVKHNITHESAQHLLSSYASGNVTVQEECRSGDAEKTYTGSNDAVDFSVEDTANVCNRYDHVVLGGTFDHLHAGHKMMLTQAVLLSRKTLTIGLVIDSVLLHKELADLIEPFETRKHILENFLCDIDPTVQYQIYPLEDKFGPSTVLPELQALVVSAETFSNAALVNAERSRKSLSTLQVVCVDLVNAAELGVVNAAEVRLSSTRSRHELLGKLLRPRNVVVANDRNGTDKFIIGLTGGSCSGKSDIAAHLQRNGLTVIDCDKLGHAAYAKDTALYKTMIEFYGEGIVDESGGGEINRAALAKLVFGGDKGGIQQLNALVWPEIERMTRDKIREAPTKLVVIDAAVLIEAGWSSFCHEVWVAFVPRTEAVRRIQERDHKTLEEAEKRLNVQIGNRERIEHAHRVFCSLWDYKYTQSQVDRALNDLRHEFER